MGVGGKASIKSCLWLQIFPSRAGFCQTGGSRRPFAAPAASRTSWPLAPGFTHILPVSHGFSAQDAPNPAQREVFAREEGSGRDMTHHACS